MDLAIAIAEFKETSHIASKKKLVNRQIKAPQVILIDQNSSNLGLTDTQEALRRAKESKLDLVVVSQGEDAPIAKIMDYGKLQYQQSKRQKQTSRPSVKEVKLRPNVGESDYTRNIQRSLGWLSKGDSVKFLIRLRGREHQHRDRATELLDRIINDLGESAKVQSLDKRALTVFVSPG